jgi:hypothetical protein
VDRLSASWPRNPMKSDAIFANHACVFLSCPDLLGRPGAKGAALQASKDSFSEGPEQIVCAFAKGEASNLRGKPKPPGLELLSEAAERGNYPAAKPNREGLKGRRAQ